jgi:hypothetical protein
MKSLLAIFFLSSIYLTAIAQNGVKSFHITSSHTSFPDTARVNGHEYHNVLYDAATHYGDSSVLIIVPPKFDATKKTDLIFWFHGWGNNIDSAAVRYDLINQFVNSKINAILVLAETAKDAPDSYGGKLERPNEFKELVGDVMLKLAKEKVINKKYTIGEVVLAGHSGAYRVMAYILENGNVLVNEVILYDALYAETDKFINWIKKDTAHRFINVYTNGGGTDVESKNMVKQLTNENIDSYILEEQQLTPGVLQQHKIVIIHSLREHNDIIQRPDNFTLFIENSVLQKIN